MEKARLPHGIVVNEASWNAGQLHRRSQMLPIDEMLQSVKISWINWESPDLELYEPGGYSIIYRVVPGLIAKVGLIEDREVQTQQYFANRGKALPVLDFKEEEETSETVRKAVCSIHGERLVVANTCTCHSPVSVLLMPQAYKPLGFSKKTIEGFMDEIADMCEKELVLTWDYKEQNVAQYQGHLVALDFGDPNRADW